MSTVENSSMFTFISMPFLEIQDDPIAIESMEEVMIMVDPFVGKNSVVHV